MNRDTAVDDAAERRQAALKKYQDLKARAEHPNTPQAEAEVAYRMAAKVMADWEIDELELVAATGAQPAIIMVMVRMCDVKDPLVDQKVGLCSGLNQAFSCRSVIQTINYDTAEQESGDVRPAGKYMEIIGYSHDARMVQELYYSTVIHMTMNLMGEKQKGLNYQRVFAEEYAVTIRKRVLVEIVNARKQRVSEGVSTGVALAIRDQAALVKDFYDNLYPPGSLGKYKGNRPTTHDPAAAARGRAAANQMDLGGTGRIAGGSVTPISAARKQIGR